MVTLSNQPAVSIEAVSKTYHTAGRGTFKALDNVSLEIKQGEFLGLLGPNGAGKTTLISILAGLSKPTSGRMKVLGFDVQGDYAKARKRLGIVPQELVFDPFFSVREALRFQSGYFGIRGNDDWIDELLTALGLADKATANMRELSGGMKRRVLVAQALVHKPPIIVLDEPTAGVDVELRQTLWHFIDRLNREGTTVLLTTHYLEEAEALCHRIAMMRAGRIIALDKTSDLLSAASHNVVQFKTDRRLPEHLAALARVTGRVVQLPAANAQLVEQYLADLRQAEVAIEDLEIRRADLEDVFVKTMGESERAAQAAAVSAKPENKGAR